MERIGVRELREQLGRRVDGAHFKGEQTVIEKNGEPRAVLVPYEWWIANGGQAPEAD
ncbi:type II toxin-antitoxin system Phd/YefM family antitoxin [Streptomyces sp. DT203]|uniref:type II toxin-antitoxin system Phd/YefM family antitoxin n=1 Tax=Streptomyces sp. DT203 TaxID=3393424 RepID=UPI003CF7CA38